MSVDQIVLAGGGHSHALLLRRWAMQPSLRPSCEITLVTRKSTTLYSGMIPGLISGIYSKDQLEIDLRRLTLLSRVGLIVAEIIGIDLKNKKLLLENRPSISFQVLSLDVGSETYFPEQVVLNRKEVEVVPIKPLEFSLAWIKAQDSKALLNSSAPFTIVGGGFSGVEVSLALRNRWPSRKLFLHAKSSRLSALFRRVLSAASVEIFASDSPIKSPALLCTGAKGPAWLIRSGLPVDGSGRILTTNTLQVVGNPFFFAVGDCAVIESSPRPPSGVWAVRVAEPLANNLERLVRNIPLKQWQPQSTALQLVGFQDKSNKTSLGFASWSVFLIGPHPFLWKLKQKIDLRFMARFNDLVEMVNSSSRKDEVMACRGCGAKLPGSLLKLSLNEAGLSGIEQEPKDAVEITSIGQGERFLQSVDGFPALVSDPWLNGRLCALHASSDIWACGAEVLSAQAVITLPLVEAKLQKELLTQTLSGIQSALKPQGAKLIGGHTLEARELSSVPNGLGVQVSLSVNGKLSNGEREWGKGPLHSGDVLLISRSIGTGVLFAAAMKGNACRNDIDKALEQISISQYETFKTLKVLQERSNELSPIHACTDVTGFGLLGHLGEMIQVTNQINKGLKNTSSLVRVQIDIEKVPSMEGSILMFEKGFYSTLAPANKASLRLLEANGNNEPLIQLNLGEIDYGSVSYKALIELLVDPQTCGPLLISCTKRFAKDVLCNDGWCPIGRVI